jgi:hypothetical protein
VAAPAVSASGSRALAAAAQRAAEGAAVLPQGWGQGLQGGRPFYYPVDAPTRIQWEWPMLPLPSTTEVEAAAVQAAAELRAQLEAAKTATAVEQAEAARAVEMLRVERQAAAAVQAPEVSAAVVSAEGPTLAVGCGAVGCGQHGVCVAAGACSCSDGYSGVACASPPDPCLWPVKVQCLGTARCIDGDCIRGAEGGAAGETGLCGSAQCGKYGRCVDGVCSCVKGWGGPACVDRNECENAPCKNGGTCFESADVLGDLGAAHAQLAEAWSGGFRCGCIRGFMGDRCQCLDCGEHGMCLRNGKCLCKRGWEGARCRKDSDECASDPCNGHGDCTDGDNSYVCSCHDGYAGWWCEKVLDELDDCSSSPCGIHGKCELAAAGGYACECWKGWAGANCQTFAFRGSGSQYKAEL